MVSINYAFKEISCKIIYYGPGMSGKTSNLQYVHKKIPNTSKGELISLATDTDRTLYFDFLPLNIGEIHGFSTKFQLYTVPGQVFYNATRKLVLRGVDGLVFVADSQRSKMDENIESLNNLIENLNEYGYVLENLPMVFQYNKRDLLEIFAIEELENVLNPRKLPYFEAVAIKGEGVFDTLKCIIKQVLDKAKGKPEIKKKEKLYQEVVEEKKMIKTLEEKRKVLSPVVFEKPEEKKEVKYEQKQQEVAVMEVSPKAKTQIQEDDIKKQKEEIEKKKKTTPEIKKPSFEKEKIIVVKAKKNKDFFLLRWIKNVFK